MAASLTHAAVSHVSASVSSVMSSKSFDPISLKLNHVAPRMPTASTSRRIRAMASMKMEHHILLEERGGERRGGEGKGGEGRGGSPRCSH